MGVSDTDFITRLWLSVERVHYASKALTSQYLGINTTATRYHDHKESN